MKSTIGESSRRRHRQQTVYSIDDRREASSRRERTEHRQEEEQKTGQQKQQRAVKQKGCCPRQTKRNSRLEERASKLAGWLYGAEQVETDESKFEAAEGSRIG